jgi:hypothetical protein
MTWSARPLGNGTHLGALAAVTVAAAAEDDDSRVLGERTDGRQARSSASGVCA